MQLIRKNFRGVFFIMVLQFVGLTSAFATTEPIATKPLLGSKDSVRVNNISTVTDYQTLLRIANPSMLPQIESSTTRIKNTVSVGIEEGNKSFIQTDFSATIVLHIKKFNSVLSLYQEFDSSFTINYAKAEGAKYNATKYLSFEDAYQVEVKIISIDSSINTWAISNVLRVDNIMEVNRDYVFQCSTPITNLTTNYEAINGELTAIWSNPNNGQTEFDLEWAWVDESAVEDYKITGNFDQNKLFSNNATRITTTSVRYNIPLFYDGEGRIFVRVRPAQIKTTGQRVEGVWTWLQQGSSNIPVSYTYLGHELSLNWQASTSFAEDGKRKSVIQYFDGTLRNRQTVTKDNTSGDPTTGTNGTTVIAESFYDYQGRPVIQVLPAPTISGIVGYARNFNKAIGQNSGYPKWAYDLKTANASVCGTSAPMLDSTLGSSKYYSANNDLVNTPSTGYNVNKFIPTAVGYPLSETRFTPDGRLASQGGVGVTHQIGSGHETKYFYETPAQEELDALFGTDAGIASHYFKNMVKDANGQYSVSYTDMHGRTVATALAGKSPDQLDTLLSSNQKPFVKQLLDNETNRVAAGGRSIISSKSLVVMRDATYKFTYELNPEQLKLLKCDNTTPICYDCLYTLKFSIVSDCNGIIFQDSIANFSLAQLASQQYLSDCNTDGRVGVPQKFSKVLYNATLLEGSYTINKELTLSRDAQSYYLDSVYVKYDTCRSFTSYYNQLYSALVTQSNCAINCTTCKAALGNNLAGFRNNFLVQSGMTAPLSTEIEAAIVAAYNNALAKCERLCTGIDDDGLEAVRSIRNMMLKDVTPPNGQYAKTVALNNNNGTPPPSPTTLPFNIFNTTPWSLYNPSPVSVTFPGVQTQAAYLHPIKYNQGEPLIFNNYYGELGEVTTAAQAAPTIADFVTNFQKSWAEQLLPHHPEFKKLKLSMEDLAPAYKFEADLNKLTTWNGMVAATSSLPGGTAGEYITNIIGRDPLFNNIMATFNVDNDFPPVYAPQQMQNWLDSYLSLQAQPNSTCSSTSNFGSASLWQMAQSMVFCRNKNESGCENSEMSLCIINTPAIPSAVPTTGCADDWNLVWTTFRNLYLNKRRQYISLYLNANGGGVTTANLLPTYTPRFVDYSGGGLPQGLNMGDAAGFLMQMAGVNNQVTANNATIIGQTILADGYRATCTAYANTWIAQLKKCNIIFNRWDPSVGGSLSIFQSDSTWLVDRLKEVCFYGSDVNHPVGSSSMNPTAPSFIVNGISYRDFPTIIKSYFKDLLGINPPPFTSVCNPYLITSPKPYNLQAPLTNPVIVTKPVECECNQITSKYYEFTNGGYSSTFSLYLSNRYQTIMTQGSLDTLLNLCNGTYQCVFLPKPISLPPVLQCHTNGGGGQPSADTTTCITCERYNNIKASFLSESGNVAPIGTPIENPDANQLLWNKSFENYANNVTGFSKTWSEYVDFGLSCAAVQNIPCASLNATLQAFYLTTIYQQNPIGTNCRTAFTNYFNSIYNTYYTYTAWMTIFLQSCGKQPTPCGPRITCPLIKQYISDFYDIYGVNISQNINCQQLFVSYMNSRIGAEYSLTYVQIESIYHFVCGVNCPLDICSFPNSYLLTRVFDAFKTANNGHPWTLPNCQQSFEDFFNSYFNLSPGWSYSQIATAFNNYHPVVSVTSTQCSPDLINLCNPDLSCASLQYIVLLFNAEPTPVSTTACQAAFTLYFNNIFGSNYTYEKIVELYTHYCGAPPNICANYDIEDCAGLIATVKEFLTSPLAQSINCANNFVAFFNNKYGSDWNFDKIVEYYLRHCKYALNVCSGKLGDGTQSIIDTYNEFLKKYPDPASQFAYVDIQGSTCESLFAGYYNGYYGTNYTYAELQNIYSIQAGITLEICANKNLQYIQFVNDFNTKYSTLTLTLNAKRQLFAHDYNNEFVRKKSPLALVQLSEVGMSTTEQTLQIRPLTQGDNYSKIIAGLSGIVSPNAITAPATQSFRDPQALLSMKQAYYLLYANGLPKDCQADFTSWFNINMGTNFTADALITQYNNICGNNAGYVCGMPDTTNVGRTCYIDPTPAPTYQPPLLCGLNASTHVLLPYVEEPCKDLNLIALTSTEEMYELYVDSIKNVFNLAYYNKCMKAKEYESLKVEYTVSEYHYTLYYYDQAGNLVRTIPPAGVQDKHGDATFLQNVKTARSLNAVTPVTPNHSLATDYRYNTLNQVITQKTPDAGISNFWYDRLGRLAISQNAKQQQDSKYSYTQYDEIGRISMVGQKPQTTAMTQTISRDVTALSSWLNTTQNKEEITRTVYDVSYYKGEIPSALVPTLYQRNVRNRISYTQIFDTEPSGTSPDKWAGKHKATTYYSYDIHGNVDTLVQDYGSSTENPNAMNTTIAGGVTNRWKKMVYNYDLISGKVNEVAYQPGMKDAFYHRYSYDAENRLTDVETSTDRVIWEKDARYSYYKHGPLARAIIGQQQVQGVDYAYTIQGWLKGVNASSVGDGSFDMGGDGIANSTNPNQVARDAYGFSLNYFTGDYRKIGTGADAFVANTFNLTNTDNKVVANSLYNGNIASMFVNLPKLGTAQLYGYKYDQLNRIKSMDVFKGFTNSTNTFTGNNIPTASADYKERASYDPNGNILSYVRNGNAARNSMDNMDYTYKPNTNQLDKVVDAAADATTDYALYNDIKQGQQNSNYEYDLIGNLVRDKSADLYDPNDTQKKMIEWNVYGKISKITKITAGQTTTILYTYDAGGNRITKTVNGKTTWYVRDASGNVMSTYESGGVNAGALTQIELHMYGSSRLGINNVNNNMATSGSTPIFTRGNKLYELTNHLGNVLVTVSDKKIGFSSNGTTIDYYNADVVTANDMYSGGMQMPGRKYQGNSNSNYRYSINGQEKESELNENITTAEYWEYDSRIVRRWNIDPVPDVSISPYNCFSGNPIWSFDIKGDTPTVHQAAQMSNDAYNKFIDRKKIDGGWKRLESFAGVKFEDKRTDFQGALYSRTVNGKTEYTFATAGTASGKDAWQDVIQTLGQAGQYRFSVQQAEALKGLLNGQELTFTGHSLGGGTAAANALHTGGVAITFNAAGTSLLSKYNLGLNTKASIQAFIIPGEAVDYYQGKVGSFADGSQVFVHPTFGKMGAMSAYIVKESSQTIFIRGKHHMMSSMYQALTKAGYGEGGDGERVVPIIMIKLPEMKLPQGVDNTINRQLPRYLKTYGQPKQ